MPSSWRRSRRFVAKPPTPIASSGPSSSMTARRWASQASSRGLRSATGSLSGVMLAHVSELRWLRSVDQAVYDALRPHVAALPEQNLQININTTTPEVLVALIDALDLASARLVLADRPFNDLGQLRAHPVLGPLLTPDLERRLVIDSQWFLAQARVRLAGIERDFFRLLAVDSAGYDFRYVSQGLP